jgi:hypothetical protein
MHNNVVTAVAEALQHHAIATLRFNFRGTGQSTGTHTGGPGEETDVMAAVGVVLQHVPGARIAVVGYSFGAAVGMRAGAADARVERLVGVALPVQRFATVTWSSQGKPTLFVVGDNDTWCPLAALQALGQGMTPSPTVRVLAGADHFFWGREGDVAQVVVGFVHPGA